MNADSSRITARGFLVAIGIFGTIFDIILTWSTALFNIATKVHFFVRFLIFGEAARTLLRVVAVRYRIIPLVQVIMDSHQCEKVRKHIGFDV